MSNRLKYAQRERLGYLDKCFTWKGVANRRDLVHRFDISTAQAALDFKAYLERAKATGPIYNKTRKAYFASKDHQPLFEKTISNDWPSIIDNPEIYDELPSLNRSSDPSIVSKLFRALDDKVAVNINYISMSSEDERQQWIAPTAFASDGERIHVRAFSFKHKEYRDYVPIRISSKSRFTTRSIDQPLAEDAEWNSFVRIHLVPRVGLTPEQIKAVKREYGFSGKSLIIETRKALEFYATRRWGLDLPGAKLEIGPTESTRPPI